MVAVVVVVVVVAAVVVEEKEEEARGKRWRRKNPRNESESLRRSHGRWRERGWNGIQRGGEKAR